jgi:hypothetical protein
MQDVTFNAENHTYHVGELEYPATGRVLQAAGLSPDFSMVAPAVLEKARDRGTRVHESILLRFLGMVDYPVWSDTAPYLSAFEKFMSDTGCRLISSEEPMVHPELKYAGTPDLVCSMSGRVTLIDVKNVSSVNVKACKLQLSGSYKVLWDRHNPDRWIERCLVLHLQPTGKYSLVNVDSPAAPNVFVAALETFYGRGTETTEAVLAAWRGSTR